MLNLPETNLGVSDVMPDLIRHPVQIFWIPAFAGMTLTMGSRKLNYNKN